MQFIENHTILFLTIVYTATILIQIIFSVISNWDNLKIGNIFLTDKKEFGKKSAIRMAEWKNNEFKKLLEERLEEVKSEQKKRYGYIDSENRGVFIGRTLELELLIERYSK